MTSSSWIRNGASLLAGALACAGPLGAVAAGGNERAGAALSACANPRLPQTILDGAFEGRGTPLAVIEAVAPAARLRLAVAQDEVAREIGLMCVTRLRAASGMIFVFPDARAQTFWMKNTLVPLDMIWVRPDGSVTSVAENVPASTRETPDSAVARRWGLGRFVVELAAGEAARAGLRAGTRLRLPALRAALQSDDT